MMAIRRKMKRRSSMMMRKGMRSWSASAHLQCDHKKEEENNVGVPRPTSTIITKRRKRMRRSNVLHV